VIRLDLVALVPKPPLVRAEQASCLERVMHLINFANEGLHEKNNRHNTWPKYQKAI